MIKIIESSRLDNDFFERKIGKYAKVRKIIDDVRKNGDVALREYTKKYDGIEIENIRVEEEKIKTARAKVREEYIDALKACMENLMKFAEKQKKQLKNFEYEVLPGVTLGQRVIPIERVGVYVPGGRHPLPSSLIMCAIPAKVAGVSEIAVCSPPVYEGDVHPCILAACDMVEIYEVYRIGGIQAIAAMAYGTKTVRKVDKIVGPGNIYVVSAKREVYGDVGIDFVAGPTELLVLADETGDAKVIAADLLAQAEHDVDASSMLITLSRKLAEDVVSEVKRRVRSLKTRGTAERSIQKNGVIIVADSLDEVVSIANKIAPEHLELHVKNAEKLVHKFKNYGTLFIGKYSAEVLGDYSSGLNHTLPTCGVARYRGGLSVLDFLKVPTTLKVSANSFKIIAEAAEVLAETEGLHAHAEALRMRWKKN